MLLLSRDTSPVMNHQISSRRRRQKPLIMLVLLLLLAMAAVTEQYTLVGEV